MEPTGSVTRMLIQIKGGDLDAAGPICDRYMADLLRFAQSRLADSPNAAVEAEDVVQDALGNFFLSLEQQRFQRLNDRSDLWQVLVMLTKRRAVDAYRKQRRNPTRLESDYANVGEEQSDAGLLANSPDSTDAFGYLAAATLRELLELLPEKSLTTVASAKLDGFTNAELAKQLEVSERTIERKLRLIRDIWLEASDDAA